MDQKPGKRRLASNEHVVALRLNVLHPPAGVRFGLQRGSSEVIDTVVSTGADLSFNLVVRAQPATTGDGTRFLGPFTQGPPAARFIYVCSGTLARQPESCWTRRAKIPLSGITWSMVEQTEMTPNTRLEARLNGTAKDGGPFCATVTLLNGGWRLSS